MSANTEIHPSITAFSWIAQKAMYALLYSLLKQRVIGFGGLAHWRVSALAVHSQLPSHHSPLTTHNLRSLGFGFGRIGGLAHWRFIHHCPLTTHYSLFTGCLSVQAALASRPQAAIHHSQFTTHYSPLTNCFSVQAALASRPQAAIHHSQFTTHYSLPTGCLSVQAALASRPPVIVPCGKALCLLKTQFAKKPKNPV